MITKADADTTSPMSPVNAEQNTFANGTVRLQTKTIHRSIVSDNDNDNTSVMHDANTHQTCTLGVVVVLITSNEDVSLK